MYHRIVSRPSNFLSLSVTPENFKVQVGYIGKTCQPMRLTEVVNHLKYRSLPPRAVAITIDDGYYDALHVAKPLLEAARVPATVSVISGILDCPDTFWWDTLERVFLGENGLPASLKLKIQQKKYCWRTAGTEDRKRVHKILHQKLITQPAAEQKRVMADLMKWSGAPNIKNELDRALTSQELRGLIESGMIDVGAHTITHPLLSTLSPEAQMNEMRSAREQLEKIIHKPVQTLAYPYGDYSSVTVKLARKAGFTAACTTRPGLVRSGDDPFTLRRFKVMDWDLETFKQKLESFFERSA